MARLGEFASKIRSKNAGPFTITVDLFFDTRERYERAGKALTIPKIAELYALDPERVSRFELPNLLAIKFSFPRQVVQGSRLDRDMHGAQHAALLAEAEIE